MKKSSKKLVSFLLAILCLLTIATLSISTIAKSYINKNGEQLIGRNLKIEKLFVNVFTGHVKIQGLVVKDSDGTTDFITLGELNTRISLPRLLNHKIIIKRLLLDSLYLHLTQNGEQFNFDDIIEHFSQTIETDSLPQEQNLPQRQSTQKSSTNAKEWIFGLYNTSLLNSEILYEDYEIGSKWNMDRIAIEIPDILIGGEEDTNVDLNLNFVDGGKLYTKISSDAENKSYSIAISLNDFSISSFLPYVQQKFTTKYLQGVMNMKLQITGNIEHLMQMYVKGSASLSNVSLTDSDDKPLLSAKEVTAEIGNFDLAEHQFSFDKIIIDGASANYECFTDSTSNISRMLIVALNDSNTVTQPTSEHGTGQTTDSVAQKNMTTLHIGNFSVDNSSINYIDHNLPKTFNYTISDIKVNANDFNLSGNNTVEITAVMQNTGTARIKWKGSLTDIANQNISININNLNLSDFSPYTLQMFGYPIKDGNLVFKSQNIISNYMLNGSNSLDMYKFTLSQKNRKIKAEYNIPLRAGLYILKDKDQHIKLELPISGSINSPEFSYKRLIFKTLGNLLVKVITSPATFVADALGLDIKDNAIAIDALQNDFTTEQYDRFAQYADIIRQKPEMKLTIRQDINLNQAVTRQAVIDLKRDYYLSSHKDINDISDIIIQQEINNIDLTSDRLKNYTDSLLSAKGVVARQDNITDKAKTLYGISAQEEVGKIVSTRNDIIMNHLISQHRLPASSVEINPISVDSLKLYNGRDIITLGLGINESDTTNRKE